MAKRIITKSELATELKLTKPRITQLCRSGLPVREDGRINRAEALAWYETHHRGREYRGGWGAGMREMRTRRHGRRDAGQIQADAWRLLLDRLCRESIRIPELAIRAGVKDTDFAIALQEMFLDFVFSLAGDDITDAAYDWDGGDDRPIPDAPDYAAMARQHKMKAPDQERQDEFLRVFDVVMMPEFYSEELCG